MRVTVFREVKPRGSGHIEHFQRREQALDSGSDLSDPKPGDVDYSTTVPLAQRRLSHAKHLQCGKKHVSKHFAFLFKHLVSFPQGVRLLQ